MKKNAAFFSFFIICLIAQPKPQILIPPKYKEKITLATISRMMSAGTSTPASLIGVNTILEKKSDKIAGVDILTEKLLTSDASRIMNSASSPSYFIKDILCTIKTPEQKESLLLLFDKIKKHSPQPWIDHYHLRTIISDITSIEDFNVLKKYLNKYSEKNETCQAILTYSRQISDSDLSVEHRNLMKTVLAKLCDTEFSPWDINKIMTSLNGIDFNDFNPEMLFKTIEQKENASIIEFASQLTNTKLNTDSPLMNYIREYGIVPQDAIELQKISLNNPLEKEAFTALLFANGKGNRFEALAFKDIIVKNPTNSPIIMVCGQRQVGKSTMLMHLKENDRKYVSFDNIGNCWFCFF